MVLPRFFVVVLLGVIRVTLAQKFYIVAPNTFRLNSDETVAVAIEGNRAALVRVFVREYPGKIKNISQVTFNVQPGTPELINIRLDPKDFQPYFLNGTGSPKLVSLTAQTDIFTKEIIIPISTQSGYVFIQTDKPIYTPNERVQMRIISLSEEVSPSNKVFKLQIKNPNGFIVDEQLFKEKAQEKNKPFLTHIYKFPTYPILGEWSATVLFGHDLQQNSTVHFELQKYVLPTFTVELQTPDVILPSTKTISIGVLAKHVYDKNVEGLATFRLGVKGDTSKVVFFAVLGPKKLEDGSHHLTIRTDDLKNHRDIGWFPRIEGSRLVVEATVIDDATGNHEIATDLNGRFSKSPFQISFKRCLRDFKPGFISVFEANVNYVDGTPAKGITTKIEAMANGKPLNIVHNSAVSDESGKVTFEIQPEITHNTVTIKLKTDDPRYDGSQAVGNFVQQKFQSQNNAYITLERSSPRILEPGEMFSKTIFYEPGEIQDIYYLVVAKGKILAMNKLPPGQFKTQQVEFPITHDMAPNFRVVVLCHHRNELLADSLKIEVARVCDPKAEVSIDSQFNIKEPGNGGKIFIRGTKGTLVGLLGVDEAVYALSKKDILTKNKVFDKFATHDLGCGPGGGLTVNTVLGNAGIAVVTNTHTSTLEHNCVEIQRRKREAVKDIVSTYIGSEKECCSLGIQYDNFNRSCEERANIFGSHLLEMPNCTKIYLDCCIYARENGIIEMKIMEKVNKSGKNFGDDADVPEFILAEEESFYERNLLVRSDFRETWIFEDILIGPDNREVFDVSLPHSITTWVIQAVSVSSVHGICVSEPQKLVSFKKIFIHLNLPYSVVRNEQVEIPVTVFNYGGRPISAIVYMYGAKYLCSGTQPGSKSERKQIIIEPHSAKTVTFPVIPLKAEDFPIKVVILSTEGSDAIEKKLHVVPEGVTKEIDIAIKLDPTNQQRRRKRQVNTEIYADDIDISQNLQVTAVRLDAPEGFIPGTARCSISAIGDEFGPAVETTVNNPDQLLRMPGGCGEQNIAVLAPTLYTMKYLKATGKLTPAREKKGYEFIRHGYGNQLSYRKNDGSYAAYQWTPTSTWLTAFIMKVFCQASKLINVDKNVLLSGVSWLINNQERDGSFMEKNSVYAISLMGGVKGKIPMTAFVLITLEECNDKERNILLAKQRAVAYIENHLREVNSPLSAAIIAYSLALSGSEQMVAANDKLISLSTTDEGANTMYWTTQSSAHDVETAGYALMTQLILNDMVRSASIVNWLNKQQKQHGCFKSTQDTVVALQALSEYSIRAQHPILNLVTNITSSNDRNFHKVLTFHEGNALVLQDVKVHRIGGTLFMNTNGQGVASLVVKLQYNLMVQPEQISRFDVFVNVTDAQKRRNNLPRRARVQELELNRIREAAKAMDEDGLDLENDPENITEAPDVINPVVVNDEGEVRVKRQNVQDNEKLKYQIKICVRYLGNEDAEMSIVDVGVFSGFEPVGEDLKELEEDINHLIQRYETSSRGVVFYLQKIPTKEKYCFAFHVVREFNVGNTQMSVIKVYDYYNPDEITTKFYSPTSNSPMLRAICEGGICECAEGGCPPKTPFEEIANLDARAKRDKLKEIACDKFDYVWKGRLNGKVRKGGGFQNISFLIEEVIKEGIENREILVGDTRTLLIRDNCESPHLGQTYLLMGKDGRKYRNSNGETWYRYLLDKTSEVYMWLDLIEASNKDLQRALNAVRTSLLTKGCLH